MSLQRCLSRLGKNVSAIDQKALHAAVQAGVDSGLTVREAEQAAIDQVLETVRAERARAIETAGRGRETPGPAVVRGQVTTETGDTTGEQRTQDDIDAEKMEPLGELRGLYKWWQRLNRMFVSAADNLDNTRGGKIIGNAIRKFVDVVQDRRSKALNLFRPPMEQFYKLRKADRATVNDQFAAYWEAVEHKPGTEQQIYESARKETRDLIDAWQKVADLTGRDLVNLGVKVFDGKKWRPLKKIDKFFPRNPDPEIRRIINYPEKYADEFNRLADILIDEGYIKQRSEMQRFVTETLGKDIIGDDYFAGIEKARGRLLPPQFYKRDITAAMNYIERWADRASQIDAFGQKADGELDIFDRAAKATSFPSTEKYLKEVQSVIYNRRSQDIWTRVLQHLNVAATGLQLGNPATATLNLIGGMGLNIVTFGYRPLVIAIRELAREGYRAQKAFGQSIGSVRESYLPLMRDLGQQDAIIGMRDREINISQWLRKSTEFMLKWGGYTPTENFIRTMGTIMGRAMLMDAIQTVNARPNSAKAKRYMEWFERNNFDFGRLAKEGGTGAYSERFMRYSAMLPQGSYQVDQVPVFVDTPMGRFLFKYQKFGTQVNRLFFKNHFGPFLKTLKSGHSAEDRARAALPVIQYLGTLFLAGEAIGLLRQGLFDYIRRGPEWDEVVSAFEDDDRARAFAVTAGRAYYGLITSGAAGFLGNYGQMFMDYTQQERVKNPLDPPGLAAVKAVSDIALRLQGQRKLTAKDLDEVLEMQISGYRTGKRSILKGMTAVNEDFWLGQRQAHRADTRYIRGVASRYAKDQGIEGARITGPGGFGRTPMSPVNREITDAMREGNPWKARRLVQDHLRTLKTQDERDSAIRSMRASMRNSMPIRIHGQPPSKEDREAFIRWSRRNLSPSNYQRILERDREWDRMTKIVFM